MQLPKSLTTITILSKLISGILFIILPFVGFWAGMEYQRSIQLNTVVTTTPKVVASPSQKGEIIEFEGVLNNFITTCQNDGVCVAIVDDYEIIINPGMIDPFPDKLGTSDVWADDIGKKVKVRAQVVDNKELTIIGAEGLYVLKINTASDNPADWNVHQGRGYQIYYPKNATIGIDNSTDKIYLSDDVFIISIKNEKTESETIQEYADESWMTGFKTLNGNTAMYYRNDQPDLVVSNIVYFLINDKTLYTILLPVLEDQNKTTQQQILDTFTFTND